MLNQNRTFIFQNKNGSTEICTSITKGKSLQICGPQSAGTPNKHKITVSSVVFIQGWIVLFLVDDKSAACNPLNYLMKVFNKRYHKTTLAWHTFPEPLQLQKQANPTKNRNNSITSFGHTSSTHFRHTNISLFLNHPWHAYAVSWKPWLKEILQLPWAACSTVLSFWQWPTFFFFWVSDWIWLDAE